MDIDSLLPYLVHNGNIAESDLYNPVAAGAHTKNGRDSEIEM